MTTVVDPERNSGTTPQDGKEKAAAFGFAAFMGLALGPAGVLIAALAVGLERRWNRGATTRSRNQERRQGWLDTQRSWLDADHADRMARQRDRQAWLESGADPEKEPAKPRRSRRAGNALRRLIANVAVAAGDFVSDFCDGARAANQTRKNGGGFRDIVRTRPGDQEQQPVCSNCKRQGVPVATAGLCADCAARDERNDSGVSELVVSDARQPVCRTCNLPGAIGYDGYCTKCRMSRKAGQNTTDAGPAVTPTRTTQPAPVKRGAPTAGRCGRCGGRTGRLRRHDRTSGLFEDSAVFCPACDGVHETSPARHLCPACATGGYPVRVRPQIDGGERDHRVWHGFIHELTGTVNCPTDAQMNDLAQLRDEDRPGPDPRIRAWLDPSNRQPAPTSKGDQNMADERDFGEDTAANARERQRVGNAGSGPAATESNATVLRAKLQSTQTTLHHIAELTDQLAKERSTLDGQVRDADEFAQVTGQSAQARTALDEAGAVSAAMGEQLGNFSQGAVSAEEQMRQASDGLKVAENAEDELRASGADGRAVAPAGAAA